MIAQVNGIYAWPYDGPWTPKSTALIVVDMQRDFLERNGWLALIGVDIAPLAAIVSTVGNVIALARKAGVSVIYTVEAYRPDRLDVPANKRWRSERLGHAIGGEGPLGRNLIAGEPGADIVAALAPEHGEPVVAKPGKSAFSGSDFDQILRRRGVRNLVFAGIMTDGAVQCTLRDANDRGYECLILEDATASDVPSHHADQIHTLALAGGHYGSIATTSKFAAALASEVAA